MAFSQQAMMEALQSRPQNPTADGPVTPADYGPVTPCFGPITPSGGPKTPSGRTKTPSGEQGMLSVELCFGDEDESNSNDLKAYQRAMGWQREITDAFQVDATADCLTRFASGPVW
eukprot:CAMPEP_0172894104 /NCGR_PEP_ID=MMETSP1075-20121228/150142_1 /TAXON_ID=2916 /ORGANISM="Ceratium fusus, Strain PA161109" /LENGTH=115 /DNA_ID=CAMNT_0013749067 /DNA_START=59 /DNA_END=403 /DNA_ORIENTATION=+